MTRKNTKRPRVLVLIGDASIEDEAPPRGSCLVHGSQRFNEEPERATPGDDLNDALPGPHGDLGTECNLGCLGARSAGVVLQSGMPKRQARLGHDHATFRDRGGDCVERAQPAMPFIRGHVESL